MYKITYRKYDDSIKEMIIKSGNPNLFPHLKIPRTTAMHWIRSSKKKVRLNQVDYDKALLDKIKRLEDELKTERVKVLFLKTLLNRITGFRELLISKGNRNAFVECVLNFSNWTSKAELCRLLAIQDKTFYQQKVETKGCIRIGLKKCKILSPNQLTLVEQQKIYDLVHDKSLGHLSVKGLQMYAFRNGILSCGYGSWRKYTNEFRPNVGNKRRKRINKVGLRAKQVNEVWHIDVTEFKCIDSGKIYLQVLMDNYSRKIINWKLSRNKGEALTMRTILDGVNITPQNLISDGGGENTGKKVKSVFVEKGINALIAKKDIYYSNSMIEIFFRTLKQRYINKYRKYKFSKLYNLINRAILSYNEMPLSSIEGARPNELYKGTVSKEDLQEILKSQVRQASKKRHLINKTCQNDHSYK